MRRLVFLFCSLMILVKLSGQGIKENLSGQVSFVSSKNVYVKFKSTQGISVGDSLFMRTNGNLIPVLIVNNLSSTSCACTVISSISISVADLIIARANTVIAKPEADIVSDIHQESPLQAITIQPVPDTSGVEKQPVSIKQKQQIKGSISAFSYSDFSNTSADNSQRLRYTLSLNARNIANSRFSVDSYISFRHKTGDWADVKSNLFNALKIYSLSVRFDLNETTWFSFGRKINPRISSIGAMDGLQIEKSFNKFSMGVLAGSRPDYQTYGFNPELFQYGGYVALNSKKDGLYNESSLAFMQQMNGSKTDRRFLYFQHSNSIINNLYLFGTFEVDLYKLKTDSLSNESPQSTFSPTGLYLSVRYKITKQLTVSGSYDARKNIIYYETYKSFIDRILENELRQGFRLQANYRITKNLMFGLQSGYRFMKSDPRPSKNVYSYLTYSKIPVLNISATLSGTYLESSYMNGKVLGASLSRDLLKGKFQTGIGYRYLNYRHPENSWDIIQNIAEMNLSWQFYKNMSLSVNYEGTFEKQIRYNRFYLQVRKRF